MSTSNNKKQQTEKTQPVTKSIQGFGVEIIFAIDRLYAQNGVKIIHIPPSMFDMGNGSTRVFELTKQGKVLKGTYGRYNLTANPWNIDQIVVRVDDDEVVLSMEVTNPWKMDEFAEAIKAELQREQVLMRSSFSIGNGLKFFSPDVEKPIYSPDLEEAINYSIYAPITFHKELKSFRRGVLLSGTYGTGKSLAAAYTAKLAVDAGLTFIYLKNVDFFEKSIQYFTSLGKCVLFVEDIDKLFENGRDKMVDKILNSLDGIDSKSDDVMFIFTTNDVSVIERAMLRPGRIDSVVEMELPNRNASEAILKRYSDGYMTDFNEFLDHLGTTQHPPAVLKEIVTRALFSMRSSGRTSITNADLIRANRSIESQVKLINSTPYKKEPTMDVAMLKVLNHYYNEEN